MDEQSLDGLWSYTTYEEGGKERPPEKVAAMAKVVLIAGAFLPGWDGIWAVVTYGYEGGQWSELHGLLTRNTRSGSKGTSNTKPSWNASGLGGGSSMNCSGLCPAPRGLNPE